MSNSKREKVIELVARITETKVTLNQFEGQLDALLTGEIGLSDTPTPTPTPTPTLVDKRRISRNAARSRRNKEAREARSIKILPVRRSSKKIESESNASYGQKLIEVVRAAEANYVWTIQELVRATRIKREHIYHPIYDAVKNKIMFRVSVGKYQATAAFKRSKAGKSNASVSKQLN